MRFSYPSGSRPLEGYTIKRGIGVGGFGEVYFALNDAGKEVALKKIQRNLDIELRGVRHCLNLKHVNLISLWDIRLDEYGESWVVMEYVPGSSLRDVVEDHPQGMLEEDIQRWFTSTASGVAYLHEHGIVHRDLKPGNIFHDQHEQVIKIGDYGLSKFISCSRRSGQTESVGTFHYMAPEIGKGEYGKEIDIYALGIILYEMLTGEVPFDGESTQEIIMKHLTMDADVGIITPPFRKVIAKALRKDPQRRYGSVAELIGDLPWPDVVRDLRIGRIRTDPDRRGHETTAVHQGSPAVQQSSKLPPTILRASELQLDSDSRGAAHDSAPAFRSRDRLPLDADSVSPPSDNMPQDASGIRYLDPATPHQDAPASRAPEVDTPPTGTKTADPFAFPATAPVAASIMSADAGPVLAKWQRVVNWWQYGRLSTTLRVGLIAILASLVIQDSSRLLPMAAILAIGVSAAWALQRTLMLFSPSLAGQLWPDRSLDNASMKTVRSWLAARPATDRSTELIGTLLSAAGVVILSSLLGVAMAFAFNRELDLGEAAQITWQILVAVFAAWTALAICWRQSSIGAGGSWVLAAQLIVGGCITGAVAFYSANSFEIDLARIAWGDFQDRTVTSYVWRGLPMLPALIFTFGALFGLSRLVRQSDPLRPQRLSLAHVVWSLVLALLLSHGFNVPLLATCMLAVSLSLAVQLSAPWMPLDQRWEVCQET